MFKKGSRTDVNNYRPISIISNFSKVFEITLKHHLYEHVVNSIIPEQHGFIKGKSTVTNLAVRTQIISEVIDNGGQVDIIYTDFTKAFDRLNHSVLLNKLDFMNISNALILLFKSYLTERSQYTQVNGHKSTSFFQTSGVPQGSILGPLCFIIFINDITSKVNSTCLLYADDLKLISNIDTVADCSSLQRDLDIISEWCSNNSLMLNAGKCNAMSYTRRQSPIRYDYNLDGSTLNRPNTFNDLGVIFDHRLTFADHISHITASAYKILGFILRSIKDFNNVETCKFVFCALTRSKLEYASVIWSPNTNVQILALERVQRRFLKSLHCRFYGTYPVRGFPQDQLLVLFKMPSLHTRRIISAIIFIHNLVHNHIKCSTLLSQLNFYIPRLAARHVQTFSLPIPRTNVLCRSPLFSMLSEVNNYSDIDIFCTSINKITTLFS